MSHEKVYREIPIALMPVRFTEDILNFNCWVNDRIITKKLIKQYFGELESTYSPAVLRKTKIALSVSLNLTMNPSMRHKGLQYLEDFYSNVIFPASELRLNILSPEEIQELIRLSSPKSKIIIEALHATACRASELVNISLIDCHIQDSLVMIKITDRFSRIRIVNMNVVLFNKIKEAYRGKKYLFENKFGRPLSRFTLNILVQNAGIKISRPDIFPSIFRRSYLFHHLDDLKMSHLVKYLGYSSAKAMMRYYTLHA